MMNFLEETITVMKKHNKFESDVLFCELSREGYWNNNDKWIEPTFQFPFSVFKANANFIYDNGFGGEEIDTSLKIVFKDKSWMERDNYDGSEWWKYNKCPDFKEFCDAIVIDFHNYYGDEYYKDDIANILNKGVK